MGQSPHLSSFLGIRGARLAPDAWGVYESGACLVGCPFTCGKHGSACQLGGLHACVARETNTQPERFLAEKSVNTFKLLFYEQHGWRSVLGVTPDAAAGRGRCRPGGGGAGCRHAS